MKRMKWLAWAVLMCLALMPAAMAEAETTANMEAELPEEVCFDLYDDMPEAVSKAAPEADFPDAAFRAWVIQNCDADGSGEISDSEAQSVTRMDLTGLGIQSLTGIERFSALQTLICPGNALVELDLTGNPALSSLNCAANALQWLKVCPSGALDEAVITLRPTLSGDSLVFRETLTLPQGCAILAGDTTRYDPVQPLIPGETGVRMGVRQTLNLLPESAMCPPRFCTFATSNKKIAKVSDAGVVTAVKVGKATVTVTAIDGRSAACAVEVLKAPSKVSLSETKLSLGVGETYMLEAVMPDNTLSALTWTVSNPDVATCEDGLLTAVSAGKTTVTARTANNKKAACTVTVSAVPTAISVDPTLTLVRLQTATLTPEMPEGEGGALTFTSSRPEIVSIDERTGLMTALEEGTATVTVTTFNGLSADCAVIVTPGPDAIELGAGPAAKVGLGGKLALNAVALREDGADVGQQFTYTSSSVKYATVSDEGIVTGKKRGKATITVTAPNGIKATCAVTVVKAPSSIKLSKSSLTLAPGATQKLAVTLSSGSFSEIEWSGYDPEVISVDADGLVTALKSGSTTLTAATFNGRQAKCAVTVTDGTEEETSPEVPAVTPHGLIAVAHRGGRGYWEENTLEAFSHSASTGATMIELDVQTTKDGVQVINHDASIKVGSKTYKIPKNTYAKLVSVKPSLCTLDEALEVIYKTGLDIQLELKESADASKCVKAIAEHNMKSRTWYISFKTKQLSAIRALDKSARLGYIFEGSIPKDLNSTISKLNISALMVKKDLLTQERLDNWHAAGLLVNAWTCNTREECRKFAAMGVDFITSDYPDYAAEVAG